MMVSMTWPEYRAGCCRINGQLRRLTYCQCDVLLMLLLQSPERMVSEAELIERLWPNPNNEPEYASSYFRIKVMQLRRFGVTIEAQRTRGYRIPREARGRPERVRLAA